MLIAKREWLLSGDTLTIRRAEDDLTVEIIRRPQGEIDGVKSDEAQFPDIRGAQ
jgi:hypothetical protein